MRKSYGWVLMGQARVVYGKPFAGVGLGGLFEAPVLLK
jgi:hypothetical protein